MKDVDLNKIDFSKDNVVICSMAGSGKSKFVQDVYYNKFSKDDVVYFFDEFFYGLEFEPENPDFDGIIKMRNGNIYGLKTILTSVVIGGRRGLTLIVDFSNQSLVENSCIEMLKEFANSDNECNLIIVCQDLKEVEGFKFNFVTNCTVMFEAN